MPPITILNIFASITQLTRTSHLLHPELVLATALSYKFLHWIGNVLHAYHCTTPVSKDHKNPAVEEQKGHSVNSGTKYESRSGSSGCRTAFMKFNHHFFRMIHLIVPMKYLSNCHEIIYNTHAAHRHSHFCMDARTMLLSEKNETGTFCRTSFHSQPYLWKIF